MGVGTGIEWTDDTWNPTVGCSRVSPGCDRCYAMTQAPRQADRGLYEGVAASGDWTGRVNITDDPALLYRPIRQTRPRLIFVNSMSDLFHEAIPVEAIARIFAVMALADQHRFQVLTKRHKRMRDVLRDPGFEGLVFADIDEIARENRWQPRAFSGIFHRAVWPLRNVWLGVSVESERYAFRLRFLQETPAAVRFVSAEPLIGPVDLVPYLIPLPPPVGCGTHPETGPAPPALDWVIAGGESGTGARVRPMHPDWARAIRDGCRIADVPFLFKQWGNWCPIPEPRGSGIRLGIDTLLYPDGERGTYEFGSPEGSVWMRRMNKHKAGRTLDGRLHDGYPRDVIPRRKEEPA